MKAISEEDKSLIVVAVMCAADTGVIDWNVVKRYLPGSYSCQELQDRFHALKSTNAVMRSNLPRDFFADSCIDYRASVYQVIEEVLSGIWRSDVLQPSGKVNLNTGEVAHWHHHIRFCRISSRLRVRFRFRSWIHCTEM